MIRSFLLAVFFGYVSVHSSSLAFSQTWVGLNVSGPPERYGAGVAFDSSRGRTVLYGGTRIGNSICSPFTCFASTIGTVQYADTWEWNGSSWSLAPISGPPPSWDRAQLAYDAARAVTVLTTSGTWEWDGVTWLQRSTESFRHPVFDPGSDEVLAFRDFSPGMPFPQMWGWNGTNWTQRTGPPIAVVAASYDHHRQRLVAVAQSFGTTRTLEWDGVAWSDLGPASPQYFYSGDGFTMAYDRTFRLTVLFATAATSSGAYSGRTWLWDGTSWSTLQSPPISRYLPALVWHGACSQLLRFGGRSSETTSSTYSYFCGFCSQTTYTHASDTAELVPMGNGQPNSSLARLELGCRTTGTSPGPFAFGIPTETTATMTWAGPPLQPFVLAAGPLNPANMNFGCSGLIDIGTPPNHQDLTLLINGLADPAYRLNGLGRATYSVSFSGVPPGSFATIQGAVFQPSTSPCPFVLTAAWTVLVY